MAARSARLATGAGPVRLQVEHLTASDGRFTDISLAAVAGEVLGIYGLVGSGRSELARAVFGVDPVAEGTIAIDGHRRAIDDPSQAVAARLAYLPEDRLRQGVFRGLSVRANAVLSALPALGRGPLASARRERRATARQIELLAIKCRGLEQPVAELSGGNQQKVVLARWLLTDPSVLILDEPTRGVDVAAKAEIHRILRQLADDGRAIVLISSDLPEVMENSDRMVVFRGGRIAGQFDPRAATPETIAVAALSEPLRAPAQLATRAPAVRSVRRLGSEAALGVALGGCSWPWVCRLMRSLRAQSVGLAASAAPWIILSLSAGAIIMAGAIDISLGSLLALSAAVGGLVLKLSYSPGVTIPLAVAAALAVGTGGGLVNAAFR